MGIIVFRHVLILPWPTPNNRPQIWKNSDMNINTPSLNYRVSQHCPNILSYFILLCNSPAPSPMSQTTTILRQLVHIVISTWSLFNKLNVIIATSHVIIIDKQESRQYWSCYSWHSQKWTIIASVVRAHDNATALSNNQDRNTQKSLMTTRQDQTVATFCWNLTDVNCKSLKPQEDIT